MISTHSFFIRCLVFQSPWHAIAFVTECLLSPVIRLGKQKQKKDKTDRPQNLLCFLKKIDIIKYPRLQINSF